MLLAGREAADEAAEKAERHEKRDDSLGVEFERADGYVDGRKQELDPELLKDMQQPVSPTAQRPMDQQCLGQCLPKCEKRCAKLSKDGPARCPKECKRQCEDDCYIDEGGYTTSGQEGAEEDDGSGNKALGDAGKRLMGKCMNECGESCVGSCLRRLHLGEAPPCSLLLPDPPLVAWSFS